MLDSITFFRIIKNGFLGFWRNLWLSAAATLVLVITLVILSILVMLYGVTDYTVRTVQERVDVSVYFKASATEQNILKIKDEILQDERVKDVVYISADEALKRFKETHKADPLISQSLDELTENPLPATLQVKAKQLDYYAGISDGLNAEKYKPYIDKANYEDNRTVIERLGKTLHFIIAVGIALAIIFSAIAILVIFNTIALTIYNRREEIEIMRLVGATNWYIRGPFLIEALLYSGVATVITGLVFIPIFVKVMPKVIEYVSPASYGVSFFSLKTDLFSIPISNFWLLLLFQLVTAVVLTIISSLLAMRKHLKI